MADRKADTFAVKGTFAGMLKDRRESTASKIKSFFQGSKAAPKQEEQKSYGPEIKSKKTYRFVPKGTSTK
jgi:hypothetical protein